MNYEGDASFARRSFCPSRDPDDITQRTKSNVQIECSSVQGGSGLSDDENLNIMNPVRIGLQKIMGTLASRKFSAIPRGTAAWTASVWITSLHGQRLYVVNRRYKSLLFHHGTFFLHFSHVALSLMHNMSTQINVSKTVEELNAASLFDVSGFVAVVTGVMLDCRFILITGWYRYRPYD